MTNEELIQEFYRQLIDFTCMQENEEVTAYEFIGIAVEVGLMEWDDQIGDYLGKLVVAKELQSHFDHLTIETCHEIVNQFTKGHETIPKERVEKAKEYYEDRHPWLNEAREDLAIFDGRRHKCSSDQFFDYYEAVRPYDAPVNRLIMMKEHKVFFGSSVSEAKRAFESYYGWLDRDNRKLH